LITESTMTPEELTALLLGHQVVGQMGFGSQVFVFLRGVHFEVSPVRALMALADGANESFTVIEDHSEDRVKITIK